MEKLFPSPGKFRRREKLVFPSSSAGITCWQCSVDTQERITGGPQRPGPHFTLSQASEASLQLLPPTHPPQPDIILKSLALPHCHGDSF